MVQTRAQYAQVLALARQAGGTSQITQYADHTGVTTTLADVAIQIMRQNGVSPAQAVQLAVREMNEIAQSGGQAVRNFIEEHRNDRIELAPYNGRALRGPTRADEEAHALANTPTTTQMPGDPVSHVHGDTQNMGAAGIEEGAEQQVSRPRKIWRRFPNTENAALKYVWTEIWEDQLFSSNNKFTAEVPFQPFDRQDAQTTTGLNITGGGAWSATQISSIGGNDARASNRGGHDFQYPFLMQIKMTTPYTMTQIRGTNIRLPNSSAGQPNWLELFDTKYQYYHVLETEWELSLYFGRCFTQTVASETFTYTDKDPKDCGYYIFWKYTNEDDPPLSYTVTTNMPANINNSSSGINLNAQSGPDSATGVLTNPGATSNQGATPLTITASTVIPCNADDFMRMGGWKHKHVMLSNIHDKRVTISGKYKFGQCKMDIKTIAPSDAHGNDTSAEGWTQTGAQPAFPENLSVIIVTDNAMYAGGTGTTTAEYTQFSTRLETEQLIQFKDLRYPYKFPTPTNCQLPTSTSFNTDAVFFTKGAQYT